MTNNSESGYPNPFLFMETWTACNTMTQGLNAVSMETFRRLSEVRTQAIAEAYTEAFSHMITVVSAQNLGHVLAGWPPLIKSVQNREAQVQQRNLDIWSSALQATMALFTLDVNATRAGASGPGAAAWPKVERRVSAVLIDFPDRRDAGAGTNTSEARESLRDKSAVASARR
jgi:hypothetical protein